MMKKLVKKTSIILLALAVLIPYFTTPLAVNAASNANTLAELRKELNTYKANKAKADSAKQQTQSQISQSKITIANAHSEIETNQTKIEQAKKDIIALDEEIKISKEKIEKIIKSYEISSSDNNYLEYIFGAKDISDFIVRYSISEQLASYQDGLIDDYENKIKENEQLQEDLAKREKQLTEQIAALEASLSKLGKQLSSYVEEALDANEDIKSTQELIRYYESLGCGENEDFSACVKIRGDIKFIKPLKKGTITSHFGYRVHPVTGQKNKFHSGTDIGGNSEGTSVYAAANGMVGKIVRKASCGGNQVYIYHTINGVKYTSGYMHLLTINVSVGQAVTSDTVIGTVGGGRGTSSYETCSTGAHLHFMIGKGWYGSTYVSYSTWVANLLNPINIISFPAKYVWFYSRY